MNDLLSLLEFTLWCLNVSGLWASIIKVTATSKRLSKLRDFTGCLINGDDITSHNLLLLDRLDHFLSQVIDGLHLSCLKSNFASLGTALDGLVNFDFNNLTFNDFGFLTDTNTNRLSESLS